MCPLGLGFKRLQSAEHFRGGEAHLILLLLFLLHDRDEEICSRGIGVPLCPQSQRGRTEGATPSLSSPALRAADPGGGGGCPWLGPPEALHELDWQEWFPDPLPPFLLPEVTPNLCRPTSDPLLGKVPKMTPRGESHRGWLCGGSSQAKVSGQPGPERIFPGFGRKILTGFKNHV